MIVSIGWIVICDVSVVNCVIRFGLDLMIFIGVLLLIVNLCVLSLCVFNMLCGEMIILGELDILLGVVMFNIFYVVVV